MDAPSIVPPPSMVPLFPLPDHVLLPGLPKLYRMFEPRYRHLVDDLIGLAPAQRWLAIPRLVDGWQSDYYGAPPFHPVAALAKARSIRPLADGEWEVIVEGIARCRLTEVPSTRPYRLAESQPLSDLPDDQGSVSVGVAEVLGLVSRVRERLGPRGDALAPLLVNTQDPTFLIDRLGAALLGDVEVRQTFLACRRVSERIELLRDGMARILGTPPPPAGGAARWEPSAN
jgi:Lon protease-like protein